MTLYTVHKVLITFAITLGAVLLLHGTRQYFLRGDATSLATGIAAAAAACAFAFYLRWFARKRNG